MRKKKRDANINDTFLGHRSLVHCIALHWEASFPGCDIHPDIATNRLNRLRSQFSENLPPS